MNKELFKEELDQIQKQIQIVEELDEINSHLQKNNWVFLHPYSQGGDIDVLRNIISKSENPDEEIIIFFARKFFDLRGTLHFVEGFYNDRLYLKDYTQVIRESIVLCLQKDFRGAICILLPVIEGTLRKCAVDKIPDYKETEIDIKKLLRSIDVLTNEYVDLEKEYLKIRHEIYIRNGMYLDQNQENQILKKHKYYFELWMKQLKNFIGNSLYLNTKENNVTDKFNRHLIYHGMEDDIEYTFSNFLRVFNSLNFLSWAIGSTTVGSSVFSVVNEQEIQKKWVDYLNILITSEALTDTKSKIGYSVESFKKYLDPKVISAIERPVSHFKEVINFNDTLFD